MTERPASPAPASSPADSGAPDRAPERIPAASVPWRRGVLPGLGIGIPVLAAAMIALVLSTVLGGFEHLPTMVAGGLGAQLWLLSLGVPVDVMIMPFQGAGAEDGVVSLVPLGLTVLTAWLSYAVGARMARAEPAGARLGGAVLSAGLAHAVLAAVVALICRNGASAASPLSALLIGGWVVWIFTAVGAAAAEGAAALVGERAVARARQMRQDYRWAGSYLWALLRAGGIGALCAVLAGAVCLLVALIAGAEPMLEAHRALGTDAAGDVAVALLHFALLPNFVLWAASWASGAGFAIGDGTAISPSGTEAEVLPMLPVLAILPGSDPSPALLAAPVLLILGGFAAGHWFAREGEDHLGEWIAVRLPSRWLSVPLVVVLTAALIGAVAGALLALLALISSGSLGIGALTRVGADPGALGLFAGIEVAIGAALALILSPWTDRRRAVRSGPAEADADAESGAAVEDDLWSPQDGETRSAEREAASRAEADRQREARRRAEIKDQRRQRAEAARARRQRRESADERRRRRRKAVRDR